MKNKTLRCLSVILCAALLISLAGCRRKKPDPSPEGSVSPSSQEDPRPTQRVRRTDGPIDFDDLQGKNPDIYAYLEIPDSLIKQPVVQHPTDDTYYLTHSEYKKKRQSGACFSERQYNSTDFDDPVTILYGHRMRTKVMFSTLQSLYSDQKSFDAHKTVIIYTPYEELHYEVFAAVPYDDRHILYSYDFHSPTAFAAFFRSVRQVRELGATFGDNTEITPEDKVLILSTCLWGNNDRRYLVLARLVDRR